MIYYRIILSIYGLTQRTDTNEYLMVFQYAESGNLHIKICNGLQPEFSHGTPDCYIELAMQCMDSDPNKRSTVRDIYFKLEEWNKIMKNSNDTNEIKIQFLNADKMFKELLIVAQKHPDHMYTSKLINTRDIIEKLSKMAISNLINVEIPDLISKELLKHKKQQPLTKTPEKNAKLFQKNAGETRRTMFHNNTGENPTKMLEKEKHARQTNKISTRPPATQDNSRNLTPTQTTTKTRPNNSKTQQKQQYWKNAQKPLTKMPEKNAKPFQKNAEENLTKTLEKTQDQSTRSSARPPHKTTSDARSVHEI
ncbi:hypothetical protein C2G38_2253191 [Gigaspora rosea]|uniref:Serine-threonine/tyrosine-protein kinase catalytic domain-containing protein n=1 Tax=Gigaspora rosea TaxID=44941 RepID=A0A397UBH6_9GLOM|nr:hypothetical protein C2G38_2253191 [Gigaspora rosea]